jgi:hypothetical protein
MASRFQFGELRIFQTQLLLIACKAMEALFGHQLGVSKMKYETTKQNIKASAKNLSNYLLEQGVSLPNNKILEALSKVFFMKNWNTLEGSITNPEVSKNIINKKTYLIETDVDCSKETLLKLFREAFAEGKCLFNLVDYQERGNIHLIELDLTKNNDNIITALFVLGEKFKKSKYTVKRMDLVRMFTEKESLTALFK